MATSILELLKDSSLQQLFLVMSFVFTFVGISGLTWRKEKLGCFPQFVFSVLGLAMLFGAGMGYFENKNKFVTSNFSFKSEQTGTPPPSTSLNQQNTQKGKKNQNQMVGVNGNGNIVTVKNNSDNKIYNYTEGNTIYYYTIDSSGNKNIIKEEQVSEDMTEEEIIEKSATKRAKSLDKARYVDKMMGGHYYLKFHSPDGNTIQYTGHHQAINFNGIFTIEGNNLVSTDGTLVMQGNELVPRPVNTIAIIVYRVFS